MQECGAVGITGAPAHSRALARAMLLSAAVLHSPREVSVTVLTRPNAAGDWDWLRWLPHARLPDEHGSLVRIGNDDGEHPRAAGRAGHRTAEPPSGPRRWRPAGPAGAADLVVLDGSYQLRMDADLSHAAA